MSDQSCHFFQNLLVIGYWASMTRFTHRHEVVVSSSLTDKPMGYDTKMDNLKKFGKDESTAKQ